MKSATARSLAVLTAGLALSAFLARADEPSAPPAPTPSPIGIDTSTSDVGPPPPAHHGRGRGFVLGELTARLNLTPAQQKTVGGILSSSESQMKALRGDDTLSREDRRSGMRQIGESTRTQIRAALTPAQQAVFDALPANSGRRGPQPPPAPSTPPPPQS
jgi:Spy/CpxP family protein refolding chaperone